MDKEKILAAARNEKSRGKEYENKQAKLGARMMLEVMEE